MEALDYSTDAAEVADSLSAGRMPWRFVMEDSLSAKIPCEINQRSGSVGCIVREKRKADRAIHDDGLEAHRLITSAKLAGWGIIRRCSGTSEFKEKVRERSLRKFGVAQIGKVSDYSGRRWLNEGHQVSSTASK